MLNYSIVSQQQSRDGRVTNKVSVKWILFVFGFCFATGILFSNRLWDSSAEPHSQQVLFQRRHEQVLQVINDDFTTNKNLSHNDDAMDELLKAHESIQSLDKSVAMLQMQSAASLSSQEMSLDSSAAVSTLSREGSARKKVFMVIGINTDLVVERDVIQLERLGCLKEHVEGYHELSAKTKIFFSSEVAMWDAEFYVKVDDDVHVNLGMLASTLDRHRSKPRVYIGCMKSGPVLSQKNVKYHEPEYWKFEEEGNSYFRHATGQIYAISKELATYISITSPYCGLLVLRLSSLMTRNMCCGTPPDCEWKALAGNVCNASFDWTCSGICKSVEKIKFVHEKCGEGDESAWSALFFKKLGGIVFVGNQRL